MDSILANVKGIEKTYGKNGFRLHPISFTLKAGEITGLVGQNGNGKTTLLNMISGDLLPDKGEIDYGFEKDAAVPNFKKDIGYINQTLPTWSGSVYENLHFNAAIHGILGKENKKYVDQLIKDLDLWEYRHLDWSALSGGYKMRFELAKILAGRPRLMILDEPLANLDIKAQTSFLNDLRNYIKRVDYPISMIVSSQHLYKIEEVSDYLIFLKKGENIYNGRLDELNTSMGLAVYELEVKTNQDIFEKSLVHDSIERFTKSGNTYLVYCKEDFKAKDFLQFLLDNDIDIQAYRNITKSSRQFFE